MINNQQLSDLSVNQLILMMSRCIPIYNAKTYDCDKFKAILNELKTRDNLHIMLFAGEHFNKKKKRECGLKIHHQLGKKYSKRRFSYWQKYKIYRYLHINKRTKIVLPFLHLALENIKQHVKDGFAVVIVETVKQRCIKMAIIDNGTGFINDENHPISIDKAVLYNHSFGKDGHIGQALWWMIQRNSPVTFIKQAGELVLVTPSFSSAMPTIKPIAQLVDNYGTTFITLFNHHEKPIVIMLGERLKQEMKKLQEEIR